MNGDLRFAHELADLADAITLGRFGARDLRVETKPDLTPVSEADRGAEQAIREHVAASQRGEGVLGEEFGDDGGDAKWIVDPIDGTTNYVRGVPVWATLLALEREGVVVLRPRLGAGARPSLVGGAGRRRVRRRRAVSRLRRVADRGRGGLDDLGAAHAGRLADARAARVVEPRPG